MTLLDYLTSKNFTNRESEVAELVSKGLSNKEVANQLFITENTVKNYLSSIYEKLNVSTRAQLIVHCLPYLGWNLMTLSEVMESFKTKVSSYYIDELMSMEKSCGGVFLELDVDNHEVLVCGCENKELTTVFKVESISKTVNLADVVMKAQEILSNHGISVVSKESFKESNKIS